VRIFLDTEFTQFRNGQLLSVGLVSDADDELVVEIHDPLRHASASEFCRDVVLPQFGAVPATQVRTDLDLGRAVIAWLLQFRVPVTLCYDYKVDRRLLLEALCGAEDWRVLEPRVNWVDVAGLARSAECLAAHDRYFEGKVFPGRHHPLVDAKAMRERWRVHACAIPAVRTKGGPWTVQVEWECNWTSLFENADGSCRTFATREDAVRALLDYAGTVAIRVRRPDQVDGYWHTFATREEAERAILDHSGDVNINGWRERVRIV
jgi:hypothetical protein